MLLLQNREAEFYCKTGKKLSPTRVEFLLSCSITTGNDATMLQPKARIFSSSQLLSCGIQSVGTTLSKKCERNDQECNGGRSSRPVLNHVISSRTTAVLSRKELALLCQLASSAEAILRQRLFSIDSQIVWDCWSESRPLSKGSTKFSQF